MKRIFLIFLISLGILWGVQSASHALTIGFNDGVNPGFYVADNSLQDSNPLVGVVTFIGSIGNWAVNVTTGISKPIIGSASSPQIDFNSVNVTSSGGGNLIFGMVDSGFTGPISGGNAGPFTFNVGGTTQGTVSFLAFGNISPGDNFSGITIASLGPFGAGAFSGTTQGGFPAVSPFGIGIVATITHTGNQATSFDASLSVPEPAVLILLGSALIGVFALRRRYLN
ncbi:MAG: PEP-CTERM sorting domain-containing protein [Syntrophaceae bacterium]|nr:PEP-CTERM sorting domain-containing protein [Syntrophaceae bacterium]